MDVRAELIAPCSQEDVFEWVDDLSRYPAWMSLVHRVDVDEPGEPGSDAAWSVELRGRVGPLARSKRLRMVRTVHQAPDYVRFERRERDGRRHSPWVLDARVASHDAGGAGGALTCGSRLEMSLHYDGRWWTPLLERLLLEQIESARDRLLTLLTEAT